MSVGKISEMDFLRRVNPQVHRLGYAETPAGWSDPARLDLRTWFMFMEPGVRMGLEAEGRRWELLGGQGIFFRPQTWVRRWTETGGRRYWVTFDWDAEHPVDDRPAQMYGPTAPEAGRARSAPGWLPEGIWERPIDLPERFYEGFQRLNDRFWRRGAAGRVVARGLWLELLSGVLAGMCAWPTEASVREGGLEDRLLELLRDAARLPFDRSPAVEELLEKAGQSHDHVARRFRLAYGLTPLAYLNQLRMERAKGLLEETELSVSEIARQMGFADYRYFTRLFGKVTERTPRQYRAQGGRGN